MNVVKEEAKLKNVGNDFIKANNTITKNTPNLKILIHASFKLKSGVLAVEYLAFIPLMSFDTSFLIYLINAASNRPTFSFLLLDLSY